MSAVFNGEILSRQYSQEYLSNISWRRWRRKGRRSRRTSGWVGNEGGESGYGKRMNVSKISCVTFPKN